MIRAAIVFIVFGVVVIGFGIRSSITGQPLRVPNREPYSATETMVVGSVLIALGGWGLVKGDKRR